MPKQTKEEKRAKLRERQKAKEEVNEAKVEEGQKQAPEGSPAAAEGKDGKASGSGGASERDGQSPRDNPPAGLPLPEPPVWLEIKDTAEPGRVLYYHMAHKRAVWEPRPDPASGAIVRFDDELHGEHRVLSRVAQTEARAARDTKLRIALAYYEKGDWPRAVEAYEKALAAGCGNLAEPMADLAHASFVRWDESDARLDLLQAARTHMDRALKLGDNMMVRKEV